MEQIGANLTKWWEAGQLDSLVTLYAPDARVMNGGAPTVQGRDAIKALFAKQLSMPGEYRIGVVVEAASANGPIAIARGTYRTGFTPNASSPKDAKASQNEGTFLVHLHKIDGKWLMVDDLGNSTKPMAM